MFEENSELAGALHQWCCESKRPFAAVQHKWSFGGSEQKSLGVQLSTTLFTNTEIMPMRLLPSGGANSRRDTAHEQPAMVAEIKRRLLLASQLTL